MIVSPISATADPYYWRYTSHGSCFKNQYREEYIPGTKASPGYVKSYTETIKVPCMQDNWHSVKRYHYHQHIPYTPRESFSTNKNRSIGKSCISENQTTGGLIGGGLAALLSKKDSYGWSIPLGAVLGMGVASSNC